MGKKLVIADIDGTLKSTFFQGLPELNRKAIIDLHNNGYLFGIASGRSVKQILFEYKKWNIDFDCDVCVAINGSSMYDNLTKRQDDYLLLSKETVEELIDECDKHDFNYHFYINDYTMFKNESEHYKALRINNTRDVRVAKNKQDFLQGNIFKMLFTSQDIDYLSKVIETLQPLIDKHGDEIKFLRTQRTCLEIVHKNTSKAFALEMFCKRHNIDLQDVYAFGDADNDNEMLEVSGHSICLKDGIEKTKEIAKEITDLDCDEGGFGDYVYKHMLINQ